MSNGQEGIFPQVLPIGEDGQYADNPWPKKPLIDHWIDANIGMFLFPREQIYGDAQEYRYAATPVPVPIVAGVYFLFYDDELIYVGKATNLNARLRAHYREWDFNRHFYITGIPRPMIEDVERMYIQWLDPMANRHRKPCRDSARKLFEAMDRDNVAE